MRGSAHMDRDGRCRFSLRRGWGAGDHYVFIGINPSTADATTDDPTVRKMIGFVRRWGGGSLSVINIFPVVATDVKQVVFNPFPHMSQGTNYQAWKDTIRTADVVVPCWGNREKLPRDLHPHIDEALNGLRKCGKPLKCLGLTKSGDPKHPLMLAYDTLLVDLL